MYPANAMSVCSAPALPMTRPGPRCDRTRFLGAVEFRRRLMELVGKFKQEHIGTRLRGAVELFPVSDGLGQPA